MPSPLTPPHKHDVPECAVTVAVGDHLFCAKHTFAEMGGMHIIFGLHTHTHIYIYKYIYLVVHTHTHTHTHIRGLLEKYPTVFFYANT